MCVSQTLIAALCLSCAAACSSPQPRGETARAQPVEPPPEGVPQPDRGTPQALAHRAMQALQDARPASVRALALSVEDLDRADPAANQTCAEAAAAQVDGMRLIASDDLFATVFERAHAQCRELSSFDDAVLVRVVVGEIADECGVAIAEDIHAVVWTRRGRIKLRINDPVRWRDRWRLWGGLSCEPSQTEEARRERAGLQESSASGN